jgi:hypothetical protein
MGRIGPDEIQQRLFETFFALAKLKDRRGHMAHHELTMLQAEALRVAQWTTEQLVALDQAGTS